MYSSPTFKTERANRTNRSNSYGPIPCRRVDRVNECNGLWVLKNAVKRISFGWEIATFFARLS